MASSSEKTPILTQRPSNLSSEEKKADEEDGEEKDKDKVGNGEKMTMLDDGERRRRKRISCATGDKDCDRINKTLLINISFLVLGVCEAIRGPTLLDLGDLYQTELETISLLFLIEGIGSFIGSFGTGYLMNRHPHLQHLILFAQLFSLGLATAVTAHAPNLIGFFVVVFFVGALVASCHTGGNILCLSLWSGSAYCGPHIHAIHFFYAFGAFLAPLFAAPFLSGDPDDEDEQPDWDRVEVVRPTKITTLYPCIGIVTTVVSYGYWHYGQEALCRRRLKSEFYTNISSNAKEINDPKRELLESKDDKDSSKFHPEFDRVNVALTLVFSLFLFLYVGMEYCYGTYLTTFAVKSAALGESRRNGARATAIFWGAFSLMRFVAIFASLTVPPIRVLLVSFCICLFGGGLAVSRAESGLSWLAAASGVLGFGMGTVFATGIAWIESLLDLDNWMGTMLVIAGTIGPDVFPVVVGQYIESFPEILIDLNMAVVCACVVLFAISYAISKRVKSPTAKTG